MGKMRLWPLAIAQFCGITALFTHVALTTVVAKDWINAADDPDHDNGDTVPHGVSTLPVALLVFFSAAVIAPSGLLMQRYGYQVIFHVGALCGVVSSGMCMAAVMLRQKEYLSDSSAFAFLCCSTIPQGLAYGVVYFYRHVGALVGKADARARGEPEQHGMARAVAYVITSGAFAGVAGPGIADLFNHVIPHHPYVGSYAVLGVVNFFHFGILFLTDSDAVFKPPTDDGSTQQLIQNSAPEEEDPPRSMYEIATQPGFLQMMFSLAISHTTMLLAMAATPLMLHGKVKFEIGSAVIQVHVLCMYLPSLVASKLLAKVGQVNILVGGLVIAFIGAALLQVDPPSTWPFYSVVFIALIIIGLGWNLTYVGATSGIAAFYRANERFKAQSFNDTVVFTMGSAGSLCAGLLYHYVHLRILSGIVLVLYVVAIVGNVIKMVHDRKPPVEVIDGSPDAVISTDSTQ